MNVTGQADESATTSYDIPLLVMLALQRFSSLLLLPHQQEIYRMHTRFFGRRGLTFTHRGVGKSGVPLLINKAMKILL